LDTTRVPEGATAEHEEATETELMVADAEIVEFKEPWELARLVDVVEVALKDEDDMSTAVADPVEEMADKEVAVGEALPELAEMIEETTEEEIAVEETEGTRASWAASELCRADNTPWSIHASDVLPYGENALPYTRSMVNWDT
jgi:hypothetical protein